MPRVKGQKEFERFTRGERLTYREAVLAMCYRCAGTTTKDCGDTGCPLILSKGQGISDLSPEEREAVAERLRRGREAARLRKEYSKNG